MAATAEKSIARSLLRWFAQNARDLPWRRTRDPYAIWVSEVMLQQTQVATVIPYWERWMKALPTLAALAKAKPERIHKLWEGLGYYSRVRNLQQAARQILSEHGGKVPTNPDVLLALPGVGRYTAGAISSIAFNQPNPVVDGNVIRVLARLFGITVDAHTAAAREEFWSRARDLVQLASKLRRRCACSHFNQALMELGALVCAPRAPRCGDCPVAMSCVARRQGRIDELPRVRARPAVTRRRVIAFVVQKSGRFLVRQRPHGVVNGRLWEFPNVEVGLTDGNLRKAARSALGVPVRIMGGLGTINHSITRYRITLEGYRAAPAARLIAPLGIWVGRKKLRELAFSSAHRKLLQSALSQRAL